MQIINTEFGEIPNTWDVKKVKDIGRVVTGKTPPTKDPDFYGKEFLFVRIPDMGRNVRIKESSVMLSKKGAECISSSRLPPDSVMVSCIATIGNIGITSQDCFTNQQINTVIPNTNVILPEWIYYFFKLHTNYLESLGGGGSVYTNISKGKFENALIAVPPLSEQRAVVKILGDLDAKIELNQQMNKTLEAMAQALFKEWFVDFRFPGHEKVKFIDGLPEGWRMGALGELILIESGKRPGEKSEVITDEFRVPLIGASSVMGYVKDVLYKEPILIIGRVGTHGIVQRVSWPAFPSDNTLVIRSKAHEYVYQLLRMIDYQSLNVGTTQPLITQTAMKNFVILIPAEQVLEKFEKCVSNLFEKIVANNYKTESLIGLRDSLLPKLMMGNIVVGASQ